ncbi:unnamed protein product, partial [Ascophyllum nodosum]
PKEAIYVGFLLSSSGTLRGQERHQQPSLSFRFASQNAMAKVSPVTVPPRGGTALNIFGSHSQGYQLSCIVGGNRVSTVAEHHDADSIECAMPPSGYPIEHIFKVKVEHLTNSSGQFKLLRVTEAAAISTISEAHELFRETDAPPSGSNENPAIIYLVRG